MLHHRRQLDREGLGQFADGYAIITLELGEDGGTCGIDERRKGSIKPGLMVHHVEKYCPERTGCQAGCFGRWRWSRATMVFLRNKAAAIIAVAREQRTVGQDLTTPPPPAFPARKPGGVVHAPFAEQDHPYQ